MEALKPGAVFGPYAIEGLVAAGGMGQVYAARHQVYGSIIALKVLHDTLDKQDDWRKRFQEEGLVGTQLKHPNVLSAREVVDQDGQSAIVMDLVKGGQTLEKVIGREFPDGLPLVQGLQVFLAITQGLDYLHGKGVVHGDLKPENVMIEGDYRKPATWNPLVTDFGTVGLIAHPVVIDGRTAVVATPRYASPEHMRGVDRIEVRSDVYCLGLLLHHLLTGRHCSDARTVREAAKFVHQTIPVVNLVDLPEDLIEVFRKATRVKPEKRYADCRELALAIRQVLDGLGVQLDLEDVQADLATEVDEEQAEAQRKLTEAAQREPAETEAPTELDPVQPPRGKPGAYEKASRSEVTLEPGDPPESGDPASMPGDEVEAPPPAQAPTVASDPDDIVLDTGMEAQPIDEEPEKTEARPRLSSSTPVTASSGLALVVPLVAVAVAVVVVLVALVLFVL